MKILENSWKTELDERLQKEIYLLDLATRNGHTSHASLQGVILRSREPAENGVPAIATEIKAQEDSLALRAPPETNTRNLGKLNDAFDKARPLSPAVVRREPSSLGPDAQRAYNQTCEEILTACRLLDGIRLKTRQHIGQVILREHQNNRLDLAKAENLVVDHEYIQRAGASAIRPYLPAQTRVNNQLTTHDAFIHDKAQEGVAQMQALATLFIMRYPKTPLGKDEQRIMKLLEREAFGLETQKEIIESISKISKAPNQEEHPRKYAEWQKQFAQEFGLSQKEMTRQPAPQQETAISR